ncbi:MAG TPA: hypothetical protein VK707_03875 [Solirubrobacteraceae bacterium]|nr:hypothetical protein [Solirubrobacteraceae bacterium]
MRARSGRARLLAGYVDWRGSRRELVASSGSGGSVLVLDRDARTHKDRRLVAHIAPDEPIGNADLASRRYLEQARRGRCRCRSLTDDDLLVVPFCDDAVDARAEVDAPAGRSPSDEHGFRYSITALHTGMSIPELRWCRSEAPARGEPKPVSVREAIAALESYEPVRAQTVGAIRSHRSDQSISVAVLRAELARVHESPIVLNRGLREAVLAAIERDALSMSEIAMRCGRVKRDAAGNESGETSWLARRVGLLPEGGREVPTCWIHTDVLALIARDGLGVSPREVEVD